MERDLLFLYAESPVHAGGDSALGSVDLPIQREANTRLPVIWGQSLKGALREHLRVPWADRGSLLQDVFGSEPAGPAQPGRASGTSGASETGGAAAPPEGTNNRRMHAGSLSVGDAQLVAMPVPTLRETFAWVTSPLALGRLARKASIAGVDGGTAVPESVPSPDPAGYVRSAEGGWSGRTVVGPFVLTPSAGDLSGWASWISTAAFPRQRSVFGYFEDKIRKDLLAVSDALLPELSVECATVAARVQLAVGRKTVKQGPFSVEYLPTETVLMVLLECRNADHLAALRELDGSVVRIGGDETIGKGLMWCRFARGGAG